MQVHFFHWNFQDTIIILEEGKPPHPRLPQSNILEPWRALDKRHLAIAQCTKGEERKRRRLVEEELQEILERSFQA